MNNIPDSEISRRLALAIGWETDQMTEWREVLYVADWPRKDNRKKALSMYQPPSLPWRKFDYRDPAVYAPIAERFNAFPVWGGSTWFAAVKKDIHPVNRIAVQADTAAKAVALAVIKAKEQT